MAVTTTVTMSVAAAVAAVAVAEVVAAATPRHPGRIFPATLPVAVLTVARTGSLVVAGRGGRGRDRDRRGEPPETAWKRDDLTSRAVDREAGPGTATTPLVRYRRVRDSSLIGFP
jgi:hypothetical protein